MRLIRLFFIATLLIYLPFSLYAQEEERSWQWIKRGGSIATISTGTGSQMEGVYEIHTDSQQNVYVLSSVGLYNINIDGHDKGDNYDNSTSKMDFILASFTCEGEYRWSKIIGGGKERPPHISIDNEDNVFMVGQFANCKNDNYPPRIENDTILNNFTPFQCKTLFMAKYSSEGEMLSFNMPQELGDSSDMYVRTESLSFRTDSEGNMYWFLMLPPGNFSYENGGYIGEEHDYIGTNLFHIFKYSPQGEFIKAITPDIEVSVNTGWGRGFKNFYINPYNNHFYIYVEWIKPATQTLIFGGQQVTHAFAIASYDQEGNFQWLGQDNTTEWHNSPTVYGLAFDQDNNIYLGGKFTRFGDILGFTFDDLLTPNVVMKTDPTFENLIWASYSKGSEDSPVSTGTAFDDGAIMFHNNELIFTGASGGPGFTWGGKTIDVTPEIAGFNTLFARFDKDTGNAIELNIIESSLGYDEAGLALATDSAGDYLVGGQFEYNLFDDYGNVVYNVGGQTDFFITKYATQACNEPMSVEKPDSKAFGAYPNPVKNNLYITGLITHTTYSLYDINGRLINQGSLSPHQNSFPTTNLNTGVYFLKLKDEKGREQTIKVVK